MYVCSHCGRLFSSVANILPSLLVCHQYTYVNYAICHYKCLSAEINIISRQGKPYLHTILVSKNNYCTR